MAEIADVVQASAALDTAALELRSRQCWTVEKCTEPILEVLWEAERRWVRSRSRQEEDTQSIGDAERQSLKTWLMRIEDAARNIITTEFSSGTNIKARRWGKIRNGLDEGKILNQLRAFLEQYVSFGYATTGGLPLAREQVDEGASCVGEESSSSSIMARDADKQRIIHLLKEAERSREEDMKDKSIFLPIYGLPGVGKTAVARLVFHDSRFQDYAKAWVDLSSLPLDISRAAFKQIATTIISRLLPSGAETYVQELDDMERFISNNRLAQLLAAAGGDNKKLLLILDDLWVRRHDHVVDMMRDLKRLLCVGRNLVVIMTTNSRLVVGENIKGYEQDPSYQLHPLSDDMCWEIIKRASGLEARPAASNQAEETAAAMAESIGREIASKCGGLPSVAQALGRMLRSVDPREWPSSTDIMNNIIGMGYYTPRDQDSPPPSLHSVSVLSHLRRAYHRLPDPCRTAFAFCAFIFPKNKGRSVVWRDAFCQMGALYPSVSAPDLWDVWALLDSSFLLRKSGWTASIEDEYNAISLTMDDVVYDFARYILGHMLIVVDGSNNGVTWSNGSNNNNACYVVVSNVDSTSRNLLAALPAGIIALRFEGCSKMDLSDSMFSSGPKHLVLLDLSGCTGKKLPSSIGQLKSLRYLNAPGIQDRVLPLSITELTRLQHLMLARSGQLLHLPDTFEKLSGLKYLDLSSCSGLKALPESFGKLSRLRCLDLSDCSGLHELPKLDTSRQLVHLDLSDCSCLRGITEVLRGCGDRLKYLNLSHRCGYSVEDWFHLKGLDDILPGLKNLLFLGLSGCLDPFCYTMPVDQSCKYVDCITGLVNLEHLDLSKNRFLLKLPESIGNLKKLQTFDILGCSRLQSLPKSVGKLKELRTLDLSGCSKLQSLPESVGKLKELRTLDISGCSRLGSLPESVDELKELRTLRLSGCRMLMPLPKNIQEKLAELMVLQSDDESPPSTTNGKVPPSPPSHAGTSHEDQTSLIEEDRASTSHHQLLMDPSSSSTEQEINEIAEDQ